MKKDTNKTAMQQLHNWAVDKWSDPGKLISLLEVVEKVEEFLPIEKEQIINAYNSKVNEHLFAPITSINKINGEEYFNQTYNK